ncbi:glycosyltransferase WbuB, partial [bacterium]|nr:glycosyltransferase WbuB [bacterium]
QFFCGFAGMLTATLSSRRFIFEIRDLWPDSIVVVGMIRDSIAIRLIEWLENLLYKRTDSIVVVAESFKHIIFGRCAEPGKNEVY